MTPVKNHDDTQNYSIFDHSTPQEKAQLLSHLQHPDYNRPVGAMLGMVVGDALGAPLEFIPIEKEASYSYQENRYIQSYNKFRLKSGQWTDHAAMGLCIADSLILCSGFNGADIRRRFWKWWNEGYNNAFRWDDQRGFKHSVGLGGNISQSLQSITTEPVSSIYHPLFKRDDSGNGSLMRLAPIAIYHANDIAQAKHYAQLSSQTTHPGTTAALACDFWASLMVQAIHTTIPSIQSFLDTHIEIYLKQCTHPSLSLLLNANASIDTTEACWRWKDTHIDIKRTLVLRGQQYNGYPVNSAYFGSFCLDALALALHALYSTTSAVEAICKAINFLGDADSVGSITGQLAGAFYGYHQLPKSALSDIALWSKQEIEMRAILLHMMAQNKQRGS